jgi:hypothetical protein
MRDRTRWVATPNAIALLAVVLLVGLYFTTFVDLDYTWQVRTGEEILRTGRLRNPDSFTFTIAGQTPPDFEWLYEVVLAVVWNAFGYGGLRLLRVVVPLLIVARRLRSEGVPWRGVAVAVFLAILVLAQSWNLRPLYCTTIGLLLLTGALHDHCTGRKRLPLWLPLGLLLWANLHPGVILGQALLVGAIGWEWINRFIPLNKPLDRVALRRLTWLGGLSFLATFVSPDPIERMLYPFRPELRHPVMFAFLEMRPLHEFVTKPPYTAGLAYVVAALAAWSAARRFRQYRLWEIALLGGLAVLGNAAFRGVQDWLLTTLALAGPHLARMVGQAAVRARAGAPLPCLLIRADRRIKRLLNAPLFRWEWPWPAAALAGLAVVSAIPPLGRALPNPDLTEWPIAAADWMADHGVEGRVFSNVNHGAYLTWRLPGRVRCYADTRGFFFPPELLEDCRDLPRLADGWPARFDRVRGFGPDYFLLETTGGNAALWEAIRGRVGTPLYSDDSVVLLPAADVANALTDLRAAASRRDSAISLANP